MIEKDILEYLLTKPTIMALCNQIYIGQAPSNVKMPWVIIEVSGGTNTPVAAFIDEDRPSVRITVECADSKKVFARNLIETVSLYLHNFRGQLGGSSDVFMGCSPVRVWTGILDVMRYQMDVDVRYIKTATTPPLI